MGLINHNGTVALTCHLNLENPDRPSLSVDFFNGLPEVIHLFDSPRLPYFILREDGSLLILFGVNPPDPDIDYSMIEIPLTRPLPPGESVAWQVDLVDFHLKDHYQAAWEPAELHGPTPVAVQVGWGLTAIEPEDRSRTNINTLLEWQNLAECTAGEFVFP
ncbi:MAG: hypothetical protein WA996_17210 [Candidatus Promineifilaceae bacterium]